MTTLHRSPAGSASALRRPDTTLLDELQDEIAAGSRLPQISFRSAHSPAATGRMVPRVDIFEKNGNLVVKSRSAGVKKETCRSCRGTDS